MLQSWMGKHCRWRCTQVRPLGASHLQLCVAAAVADDMATLNEAIKVRCQAQIRSSPSMHKQHGVSPAFDVQMDRRSSMWTSLVAMDVAMHIWSCMTRASGPEPQEVAATAMRRRVQGARCKELSTT